MPLQNMVFEKMRHTFQLLYMLIYVQLIKLIRSIFNFCLSKNSKNYFIRT